MGRNLSGIDIPPFSKGTILSDQMCHHRCSDGRNATLGAARWQLSGLPWHLRPPRPPPSPRHNNGINCERGSRERGGRINGDLLRHPKKKVFSFRKGSEGMNKFRSMRPDTMREEGVSLLGCFAFLSGTVLCFSLPHVLHSAHLIIRHRIIQQKLNMSFLKIR